jgi:hypothetical protein
METREAFSCEVRVIRYSPHRGAQVDALQCNAEIIVAASVGH